MPESAKPEVPLRAVQKSRQLARAGIIFGILPPVLVGPLLVSYLLWIAPHVPDSWPECPTHSCPQQQVISGLA